MTDFDEWLRQLAAAGQRADGIPPATRGLAWEEPIEIEGDWTGSTLEGSIREAPDAETVLATFAITGPTVASGVSSFTASLSSGTGANSTGSLPADDDGDGVVTLPCSFRLTPSGGSKDLLFGGIFIVLGAV